MKVAIYACEDTNNSLHTQVNLYKNYLQSVCKIDEPVEYFLYSDTESNLSTPESRPGFTHLLTDAQANKFNLVITGSLLNIYQGITHFNTLCSMFSNHNINLVLVKEQLDTATPMGQAMLRSIILGAEVEYGIKPKKH